MNRYKYIISSQASLPTQQKLKGGGNKIVVGTVVKSKMCELEEEVRAGSSRSVRKELTGLAKVVLGRSVSSVWLPFCVF